MSKKTGSIYLFAIFLASISKADFNILAVGDTGKGNPDQYQVGKSLAKKCTEINCQFVLLLGDNIYDVGISSPQDPQMVEKFEKPYANVRVPFYVALGNHDYGKTANDWIKGSYQIEYSKLNPNYVLPSYYYKFEKEDALFIVLDTSRLFHDKDSDQQINFVKNAISNNTKKWIVVVAHHPYISNGKHGNAGNYDGVPFPPYSGSVIKKLVENHLCGKIDIFIGGHDHHLQTLPGQGVCSKTVFVVSGTGASASPKLSTKNPSHFQSSDLGYTGLQFKKDVIGILHYDVQGSVLHTHTYKKIKSSYLDFFSIKR